MKYFSLLLIISIVSINTFAQNIKNRIDTGIVHNDHTITTSVPPNLVYPIQVGGVSDTIYAILKSLTDTVRNMASTTNGLNAVCTIGDTTTTSMVISENQLNVTLGVNNFYTQLDGAEYYVYSGATFEAGLGMLSGYGGNPQLGLKNKTSSYNSYLYSAATTRNNYNTLPDEPTSTGSGLASALVAHTTQNPITVGIGSSDSVVVSPGNVYVTTGSGSNPNTNITPNGMTVGAHGGNIISASISGGVPVFDIQDIFSGNHNALYANLLSGNVYDTIPAANGVLSVVLQPVTVKTTTATAAPYQLIPCDASAGSFTVTLPSAPHDKSIIELKLINVSGTYSVTVNAAGSDVFNKTGGGTALHLTLLNQVVKVQYNAANAVWYVEDFTPASSLPSGLDSLFKSIYIYDITDTAKIFYSNLLNGLSINSSINAYNLYSINSRGSALFSADSFGNCSVTTNYGDTAIGFSAQLGKAPNMSIVTENGVDSIFFDESTNTNKIHFQDGSGTVAFKSDIPNSPVNISDTVLTGLTTSGVTTVQTFTTTTTCNYNVSGHLTVTALVGGNVNIILGWTDENSVLQNIRIVSSSTASSIPITYNYNITAKSGTAISSTTFLSGVTSTTYSLSETVFKTHK